jgi:ectoine hydroxylase-related dioxygenase (phytanoyl-CoA dioxygenase family)
MSSPNPSPSELQAYHDQGYLILRQAFGRERIQALRRAIENLVKRARRDELSLNWIDRDQGLPERTGHLLHPEKYDPAFAEWLAEDLAPQLETFLGGPGRHSLFGMLAGGGGRVYTQAWHRDIGKPGAADEVEFLQRHHGRSVQFNAPLIEADHFLHIVPSSHLRDSTTAELVAAQAKEKADMPGALVVELEPGDIVYYNANLWHRGWNSEGKKRWTMHCAFWKAEYPVMQHEYGQRDALLAPGHLGEMPAVAAQYIRRYLEQYPEGDAPNLTDL